MDLTVYNGAGRVERQLAARDDVFDAPFAQMAIHQAYLRQRANARQGNHDTLSRGEVQGSTRKLFRQKGTGRARQGSVRAPHRRGGGIAHGPKPRSYRQDIPKKMRRSALRSALSAKARDGEVFVIDGLDFPAPKTKQLFTTLSAMGLSASTLLVTTGGASNVTLSARNIPWVDTLPANLLNVVDIINHRNLVLTADAVAEIERIWGVAPAGNGGSGDASV